MRSNEGSYNLSDAAEQFIFGDTEALCNHLLSLVRTGKKTATCGSIEDYISGSEAWPKVGRKDAAMNWDGTPALLIQTVHVEQIRFCDVDESFALAEGENADLAGWQRDHQAFFERNGGFSADMLLVCERFKLVHDFESSLSALK